MTFKDSINTFDNSSFSHTVMGHPRPEDPQGVVETPGGTAPVGSTALELVRQSDLDAALATQLSTDHLLPGDPSISPKVVTAFKPANRVGDEIRALRSQLLLRGFGTTEGRSMLAIVSPHSRDGRSFVAANLAVAFAQLGLRTLLVDADFRRPCQEKLFHMIGTAGLAGILAGRAGTEVVNPVSALPGLRVLTAGEMPHNPQDLISKPIFSQLLTNAARKFDVVLVDTPAADTASDAEIIAARTGAALVVVRKHKSRLESTNTLVRQLQRGGVELVGSVLNQY
jgi:protein-tyrosine kinase